MPAHRTTLAAVALCLGLAACSSSSGSAPARTSPSATSTSAASTAVSSPSTPASPAASSTRASVAPASSASHTSASPRASATRHVQSSSTRLPLDLATDGAGQVITVTAGSTSDTGATLQAWDRTSSGWSTVGPPVQARLGSDGMSTHASESSTATPIGSFTLTQAFGHDADPGTRLPYFRTTPADWWISQEGPLYNTHQHCASDCAFTQGNPNEHLYYETPYYDYAVVIDYNTRNAPGGVRQGAGSAFFLHVTVDPTTQGCVSIPASQLVRILRWLDPAEHPRILIGTG